MVTHKIPPAVAVRTLRPKTYVGIVLGPASAAASRRAARGFRALYGFARRHGVEVEGAPFLVARGAAEGAVELEAGLPVANAPAAEGAIHPGRLPGGRNVVALYQGPVERAEPCYQEVRDWIAVHGLEPSGPPREVFLNGPADVTSAEQMLTELVWPLR